MVHALQIESPRLFGCVLRGGALTKNLKPSRVAPCEKPEELGYSIEERSAE
jgi:hypothetical protein